MTPETFTASYCAELGLTGEAKPIIAHAIHEEILKHKKDAYETGLYGPGAIQYESREDAPKRLRGVWRDYWDRDEFGPVMIPLTAEMMQASEEGRSREARSVGSRCNRAQLYCAATDVVSSHPCLTIRSQAYAKRGSEGSRTMNRVDYASTYLGQRKYHALYTDLYGRGHGASVPRLSIAYNAGELWIVPASVVPGNPA